MVVAKPLITIGVTAYNAETTIEQALASAFEQSWRPIEVIIVDDCSTDATYQTLLQWQLKHPELHVFQNPVNGGVAVSRNRIIAEAQGEFLVFFDDDDESVSDRLQQQWERITQYEQEFANDSLVICHTARHLIYPDGGARIEPTMGQRIGKLAPNGYGVAERILFGKPLKDAYGACPTCCQMSRLSTYKYLNGFDGDFRRSEDTEFNVRLALAGGHFVGIAQPLVVQRMTKTAEKSLADESRYMLLLLRKHRVVLEQAGQYYFCCCWLKLKQAWLEGKWLYFSLSLIQLALSHPLITLQRLSQAWQSIGLNRAFARFHRSV